MHMTTKKPMVPGCYWFLRAGGPQDTQHLIPIWVKKSGRGLTCTTDTGRDRFSDWTALSQMHPEHMYSNIPIPQPVIP